MAVAEWERAHGRPMSWGEKRIYQAGQEAMREKAAMRAADMYGMSQNHDPAFRRQFAETAEAIRAIPIEGVD